jgi:hypothetical protein
MSLDVLRARVAFRDRAFIDVMDLALRFVVVHGKLYARVSAFTLLPCLAVTLAAAAAWGWMAAWAIAFFLSFVAQVPFTVLASRLVFQDQVSARAVVRAALADLPRVLGMRLMWIPAISLTSLFVVPGMWLGAIFLYVDEVMILERSRVGPAFGRSQRIASGSMGETFAALAMVIVVPLLAVLMADVGGRAFIGDLLQFRAPEPVWTSGGSVLAVLGWFGVIPYVASARFFTYLNVRTRAEGWDIQTRFAAIAARTDGDGEREGKGEEAA